MISDYIYPIHNMNCSFLYFVCIVSKSVIPQLTPPLSVIKIINNIQSSTLFIILQLLLLTLSLCI